MKQLESKIQEIRKISILYKFKIVQFLAIAPMRILPFCHHLSCLISLKLLEMIHARLSKKCIVTEVTNLKSFYLINSYLTTFKYIYIYKVPVCEVTMP